MPRPILVLITLLTLVGCKRDDEVNGIADAQTPALTLDNPAAGAWVSPGTVRAQGISAGLEGVSVNGATAEVEGGKYGADVSLVRGINVVEAVGSESDGDELFVRNGVLAGTFGDPSQTLEGAINLRLNQGGIDDLMELVGTFLDPDTINAAATGMNPIYQDSYGVWGYSAVDISADIESISFGTPELAARPSGGALSLSVALPDLDVLVNATGDVVGVNFDTTAELMAERAEVEATLVVGAEDGHLTAELVDAEVNLVGFSYDTSLLPWGVEDYLFVDTIRGKIEDMVLEQIETMVPSLLDDALAGLDPSFELELLGVPLSVAASFAEVETDSDGVAMVLDLDVDAPSTGTKSSQGFLLAEDANPKLDHNADLTGAISDDMLNALLFQLWEAGMLDMRLSTDDGSLPAVMLTPLKADEGTIQLDAILPPVVVQQDGGLELQMGELAVRIDTPGGELGNYVDLSVNAFVQLELGFKDGALDMSVGETNVVLMVRDSDWGASNETITRVVEQSLPIDTLLLLVGALNFDIPSIYGLSIDKATVSRDDGGSHTDLEVELAVER